MRLRVPAVVLAILVLAACGGAETPQAQDQTETAGPAAEAVEEAPFPFRLSAQQEEGKVVYETMCWSCHGSAGRGDGPAVRAGSVAPPRDFTAGDFSAITATQLRADFRAQVGGLDAGHPHMRNVLTILDEEAFGAALSYIPALTYPTEIPGSAIAGRVNYLLRCQGCHGWAMGPEPKSWSSLPPTSLRTPSWPPETSRPPSRRSATVGVGCMGLPCRPGVSCSTTGTSGIWSPSSALFRKASSHRHPGDRNNGSPGGWFG